MSAATLIALQRQRHGESGGAPPPPPPPAPPPPPFGRSPSPAIAGAERDYAAAATVAPLNTRPCLPAEITTFSPSLILPERMSSASGSCTDFWITRLSGRAP